MEKVETAAEGLFAALYTAGWKRVCTAWRLREALAGSLLINCCSAVPHAEPTSLEQ